MHRATHGGVEEKREPAAMDQPHGIVEAGRGRRLECHAADLDRDRPDLGDLTEGGAGYVAWRRLCRNSTPDTPPATSGDTSRTRDKDLDCSRPPLPRYGQSCRRTGARK